MTLRDIHEWGGDVFDAAVTDVMSLGTSSPLDWPLWIIVPLALIMFAILKTTFTTIREEENNPELAAADGFWGSIWAALIGCLAMLAISLSAFSGNGDLPTWLGYVGLFNAAIFGYGFLLKLAKKMKR